MIHQGYLRTPTLAGDRVIFVCEDELYEVPSTGGQAQRLTSSEGPVLSPRLSPSGEVVAYSCAAEGDLELWLLDLELGETRRLSYLGGVAEPRAFSADGKRLLFSSTHESALRGQSFLYWMELATGAIEALGLGPARDLALGGPGGAQVLGRHTLDPARWKRYRGGTVGQLWLDAEGSGTFSRLALEGNLSAPFFLGDRLYFVSDHEGHGNLYSASLAGADKAGLLAPRRHTHHQDFYLRNPQSDGVRVVYHAGGSLFLFDPKKAAQKAGADPTPAVPIPVHFHSTRSQRQRRFVEAGNHLESIDPHPLGHLQAAVARGQVFSFGNWEGPALHHAAPCGGRHRLAAWLPKGDGMIAITDGEGEERLVVLPLDPALPPTVFPELDLGRAVELLPSPAGDEVALLNHRHEVLRVHLKTQTVTEVDKSRFGSPSGLAYSPCGSFLAYGFPNTARTTCVRVAEANGTLHEVTEPLLHDSCPAWDPSGSYLYFIGTRVFNPVSDALRFDYAFPWGKRPYAILLQQDKISPFTKVPHPFKPIELAAPTETSPEDKKPSDPETESQKPAAVAMADAVATADAETDRDVTDDAPTTPTPIQIDWEGIQTRCVPFPIAERQLLGIGATEGKLFILSEPVEGELADSYDPRPPAEQGELWVWDHEEQSLELVSTGVGDFALSADGSSLVLVGLHDLRVIAAGEKLPTEEGFNRQAGWVDLGRLRIRISPPEEWRQIFHEAWRLQRDHFWNEAMSDIDWLAVRARYLPLLDLVASRSELSDLLWEMQGELGTSHAYEFGGDQISPPDWRLGKLGADFAPATPGQPGLQLERILDGEPGELGRSSPLAAPGLNLQPGDRLLAVNGMTVGAQRSPGEAMLNLAGEEVALSFQRGEATPQQINVKTLHDETALRYRVWVKERRARVHTQSDGQVGYVHIPNMQPDGFAAFMKDYLRECERQALVVDLRSNGGGNMSQLILEILARKRIGFDLPRYGEPQPYFQDAPAGPLVALTDERAGSDGDIFSHCFKLLELGPLVGTRTWGGVVGIWPRHPLVDGGTTTQPEYAFWFKDVGWSVENHGVDPDIEVPFAPQDWKAGDDPQLKRAVSEALDAIKRTPPLRPAFGPFPSRTPPKLPPSAT